MKKQQLKYFILGLILILLNGCTPKKNADILSDKQKYTVYQNVLNEIDYHKNIASEYQKNDYLLDAIDAYKKVNFFKGKEVYSKSFFQKLNRKAKSNGKKYYKKASKVVSKDKIKALHYLNKMMENDPTITKGTLLLKKLKSDDAIKKFLSEKELSVFNQFSKNGYTSDGIYSLNIALKELIKYDNQNNIVKKTKKIIKEQYPLQVENAISLYNEKKYDEAKADFYFLKLVYKKNKIIQKYLTLVDRKKNRKKTKTLLSNKKHNKSTTKESVSNNSISNEEKNPKNDEYSELFELPDEEYIDKEEEEKDNRAKIPELLKKGFEYYYKQDLINAKKVFLEILRYNPYEKISLIYVKKIREQLKTIKSLR